jgi:hypothetical protein
MARLTAMIDFVNPTPREFQHLESIAPCRARSAG